MKPEFKDKIIQILEQETHIDIATIDPDLPIRDQIVLDSMKFLSIIARIEQDLQIEIPISILQVVTLNEFLNTLSIVVQHHENR